MQIVATGFGDPSVLKIVPTNDVAPTTGEVAIDVRAAGVNHVDYTRYADRAGAEKHGERDNPFPMKLGVEVSGVVSAVGADAHGPAGPIVVGDEVIAYRVSGATPTDSSRPARRWCRNRARCRGRRRRS
ncbi:alcohol dehydrogenase catalytic domain-containing protein [Mycobacterium sp.]|uniref:alcohol dehydrogenase catalytic domain-containing protein n=1 Tax=Mycobacterium sp. TaxID=1785 RepID=UPI003D0C4AF3